MSCVMSFPRANIGRWGKGRGENIAIFLTLISTSHVEQLCSSLSQTNYSMIVGFFKRQSKILGSDNVIVMTSPIR